MGNSLQHGVSMSEHEDDGLQEVHIEDLPVETQLSTSASCGGEDENEEEELYELHASTGMPIKKAQVLMEQLKRELPRLWSAVEFHGTNKPHYSWDLETKMVAKGRLDAHSKLDLVMVLMRQGQTGRHKFPDLDAEGCTDDELYTWVADFCGSASPSQFRIVLHGYSLSHGYQNELSKFLARTPNEEMHVVLRLRLLSSTVIVLNAVPKEPVHNDDVDDKETPNSSSSSSSSGSSDMESNTTEGLRPTLGELLEMIPEVIGDRVVSKLGLESQTAFMETCHLANRVVKAYQQRVALLAGLTTDLRVHHLALPLRYAKSTLHTLHIPHYGCLQDYIHERAVEAGESLLQPWVDTCVNLRDLDVSYCTWMHPEDVEVIVNGLQRLKRLNLHGCGLTDAVLPVLETCATLTSLDLGLNCMMNFTLQHSGLIELEPDVHAWMQEMQVNWWAVDAAVNNKPKLDLSGCTALNRVYVPPGAMQVEELKLALDSLNEQVEIVEKRVLRVFDATSNSYVERAVSMESLEELKDEIVALQTLCGLQHLHVESWTPPASSGPSLSSTFSCEDGLVVLRQRKRVLVAERTSPWHVVVDDDDDDDDDDVAGSGQPVSVVSNVDEVE